MTGAVTRQELNKTINETNSVVRVEETNAIQLASVDASLRATGPSPPKEEVDKLDPIYLWDDLYDANMAASTINEAIEEFNQCLNVASSDEVCK
ncbi:unnamed protein product [Nezara viridula]|uniref:Uncharacterized protein n=1 Tax=Nezara viridula TaxID=85310 RepID=A0A9P0MUH2_NEZVI|nr:unnamed protein product [Nezara viridula]